MKWIELMVSEAVKTSQIECENFDCKALEEKKTFKKSL
tara:strand:+ start:362 stop:475 length:114 start_codon:yes stop_codon:yes gene_type:complete